MYLCSCTKLYIKEPQYSLSGLNLEKNNHKSFNWILANRIAITYLTSQSMNMSGRCSLPIDLLSDMLSNGSIDMYTELESRCTDLVVNINF